MEGMPANDSTPKRISFVNVDSLVYAKRCGKENRQKGKLDRPDNRWEDSPVPSHVLWHREDEFEVYVRKAFEKDYGHNSDKDAYSEQGLCIKTPFNYHINISRVYPHFAIFLLMPKLAM
jgi:hypothetical protein